jgi:AraC-type DNA-binding domain-containing proteins
MQVDSFFKKMIVECFTNIYFCLTYFIQKHMNNRNMSIIELRTEEIYKKILLLFDEKKVYLDPTLSLIGLSEMVGTNTTYLSNTINQFFGCNLRTLINKYRIDYAKHLLAIDTHCIKELHRRSGFASRSAFYAAFQRLEGNSPLGYLIQVKKKESNINKKGEPLYESGLIKQQII